MYVYTYMYIYVCICPIYIHIYIYIYTYIHTYIHTYIYTYIHTFIHTIYIHSCIFYNVDAILVFIRICYGYVVLFVKDLSNTKMAKENLIIFDNYIHYLFYHGIYYSEYTYILQCVQGP